MDGQTGGAPRLMLVTDRRRSIRPLPEVVAAAVAGGVDAVHLREPDLEPAARLDLAERLREVIGPRAALVINGDAAAAAALGLGLHLPERGMATAEARRIVGARPLLGRSVHSAAAAAAAGGADYLLAGHLFPTASKPGREPIGLDGLRRIAEVAWEPVLAVGGIDANRVAAAVAAGAVGVAVIGAIAAAPDPEQAAAELRAAVDEALDRGTETETMVWAEKEASMATAAVPLTVNGKPVEVEPDTTVTDFLSDRGLRPTMVIVEVNGTIVARSRYDETLLAAGDAVEVVHAVGGG